MYKLRFSKPKYVRYGIDNSITLCNYHCVVYDTKTKQELYKFESVGKAIRNPADKDDQKLGSIIAEGRAKKNAYRTVYGIFSLMHHKYKFVEDIIDMELKMKYLYISETNHVRKFECEDEIHN